MPIGPALPPHLAHLANRSTSSRSPSPPRAATPEEEDDPYGPALPPHLAKSREGGAGPSKPRAYESPSPPRLPATRPTQGAPTHPLQDEVDGDDDDDDDDIGPRPEMAASTVQRSVAEEFREREERRKAMREEEGKPQVRQREEWMLVPPTSGVLSNELSSIINTHIPVDPLKRPSTFSRSTAPSGPVDTTAWTETPSERAQRLADEVAGIKRKPAGPSGGAVRDGGAVGAGAGEERKRRREEEIRNEVARHTRQNRGPSLLEKHQKKDPASEEPKAIWDHARDMGITGRLLSEEARQAKIKDARGLNDRFGHGKSGAYQI